MQDLESASGALKRALFLCPNHKGLHAMKGEVHWRLQVCAEAQKLLFCDGLSIGSAIWLRLSAPFNIACTGTEE